MLITSRNNDLIKKVKSLNDKKFRNQYNQFIIEGDKMINEAIKEKMSIEYIFVEENYEWKNSGIDSNRIITVSSSVMEVISSLKNSQGVLAVAEKKTNKNIEEIDLKDEDLFLILDNVQDPGNIGTIIRTADSIGLKYIFIKDGSCDIYNPKVLRSTMGSIFRVECVIFNDSKVLIEKLKQNNIKVYATNLKTNKSIYDVDFKNSAIIVGNESNGVSEELLELADENIKIPMRGNAESLNVAIATSIILYEAYRQFI